MTNFVIVSTNQNDTATWWQKKLFDGKGKIFPEDTIILCIHEDWPGGAGNGLGTLYAFEKASKICQAKYGIHLFDSVKNGATALLYHTAGQGKRLAPLVLTENNSKGSVKLPSHLLNPLPTISVLEAVIYQTLSFAPLLAGRFASFWGDQIFLPENRLYPPKEHINIFGRHEKKTDADTWRQKALHHFGLIISRPDGVVQNVDKISYQTLKKFQNEGMIPENSQIGISLGSFSLSFEMLTALLEEFSPELHQKQGKLDTDPHFWMPATLDEKTYSLLMNQRGQETGKHWSRIQTFVEKFTNKNSTAPFFGLTDIGEKSYWWDFGTVNHFFQNVMKLLEDSHEGMSFRKFLKIEPPSNGNLILGNCHVNSQNLKNCILVDVEADKIDAKNCLFIKANIHTLKAEGALLYRVVDSSPLVLAKDSVRADINEEISLSTTLQRDGKADWKERILENRYSYETIFALNESLKQQKIKIE